MGISVEEANDILGRAKSKNDGVYLWHGVAYRVRKGRPTHLAKLGTIYQWVGHFFAVVGEYKFYQLPNQWF